MNGQIHEVYELIGDLVFPNRKGLLVMFYATGSDIDREVGPKVNMILNSLGSNRTTVE